MQFEGASTPLCLPMARFSLSGTGSDPALPTNTFPAKHKFHGNNKIAMKEGSRMLSMPDILCCQQKRTIFPKVDSECCHVAVNLMRSIIQKRCTTSKVVALGSTSSKNIISRNEIAQMTPQSKTNPKNSSSPQNTSSIMSSMKAPKSVTTTGTHHKELYSTSAQPQSVITASSYNRRRCWKRVKRGTVNCFQSLCCCLFPQRRSHASQKKVTPVEWENGVT